MTDKIQQLLKLTKNLPEHKAISDFYGTDCAKRSQVPLINHINEGVIIIGALDSKLPDGVHFDTVMTARAYCLHPLFQNERELSTVGRAFMMRTWPNMLVLMALSYREYANAWLADKVSKTDDGILLFMNGPDASSIPEIRAMLIADKVQNYKDFLAHHLGTHARSDELNAYFLAWLEHLGITDAKFTELCQVIDKAKQEGWA